METGCVLVKYEMIVFFVGQASQYSRECMKRLVCPDGDWFKLTWDIDSSRETLNNYISRGIHSATKKILDS
jgi:hypothetical protein